MKISFKAFMVLLAAAVLSGCATPNTVISKSYNFDKLKHIGITKFDNPQKIAGIEDLFAQQLIKKGFTVVEREKLDSVIKELKLSASGLFDEKNTKELGRILGVDALLIGEVTYYSPKQTNTYTQENDAVFAVPVYKRDNSRNPDGSYSVRLRQVGTRDRVERHRIPVTVTTNPQVGMVAKIVDTETAEVIWVGSMVEEGENVMDAEENCAHFLIKSMWKDIKILKKEKSEKK